MSKTKNEEGFSYIDVVIGMLILMIGVMGLAGAISANLIRAHESDKKILAKQIALSTLESIFARREIKFEEQNSWHSIGNVNTNYNNGAYQGIFLTGFRPIRESNGGDGTAGTADDACNVGANCQVGSGPVNNSQVIKGFERRIEIIDVTPPLGQSVTRRQIIITVKYQVNSNFRTEVVSTLIGNYR